ncbi:MAG: transposase [Lachnospiraceae bacterium]|nr:transposase [Pseudomonadota bacterium]MEE3394150.1 transposase [Lachnospiraceae bacterium]
MSNSQGSYAVPENIRKMKPRGTMVKKIKGHYYVYGMKCIKDEKTGKWKTKILGIMGKITEKDGYIPNKDDPSFHEFGTYYLFESCAKEIRELFFQAFGKNDDARRIWICGMIYAVNGFRPICRISHIFLTSYYWINQSGIKLGETAVCNMLENLGRRDDEAKAFQELLTAITTEVAIDGHVIPRYSALDGMTEFGYKHKKLGCEQVNLLTAFDTINCRPVAMRMFDGSKNDKASVKELIDDVLIEKCLYLMDRGFQCDEVKQKIASVHGTYIMPVCSLTNSYKEAMKRGPGRLKAFTYTHREGIHTEEDLVEYRIASESSGTRVIYYRNMKQAMEQKNSYLKCIKNKVEGYTDEGLEKAEMSFGVIVLETTHSGQPEDIYSLYKRRWRIETFYDYLKHQMDFNALGVQDWAKLQGLSFMMMLASLIRGACQLRLKDNKLNMSMPDVLSISSSVKLIRRSDKWFIEVASKKERELFKSLNVSLVYEFDPKSDSSFT